jgi:CheY-like chemotaxis protein
LSRVAVNTGARPRRLRVLCVDDEPAVLEGLRRTLRRDFDVATALSGSAGLRLIEDETSFAVIVSDMRMPMMDGATFLRAAKQRAPLTVRLLLTGEANLNSAVAAVNEGGVYRFMLKPVRPPDLLEFTQQAAALHQRDVAHHGLVDVTLDGAVKALYEMLTLAAPQRAALGKRIARDVAELAAAVQVPSNDDLVLAGRLSMLGWATLSPEFVQRVHHRAVLSDKERKLVKSMPSLAAQLVARLPRLEATRDLIQALDGQKPTSAISEGANVLRVAHEFACHDATGRPAKEAVALMRGRPHVYDQAIVDVVAQKHGAGEAEAVETDVFEIDFERLEIGMVLAADLRTTSGMLLVKKGNAVTGAVYGRLDQMASGKIQEPIMVVARKR